MVTIINVFVVYISTGTLAFGHLHTTASARLLQAHKPSSRSKYQSPFWSFIMFCNFYQLSIASIHSPHIVAFIDPGVYFTITIDNVVKNTSSCQFAQSYTIGSHPRVSTVPCQCIKRSFVKLPIAKIGSLIFITIPPSSHCY